MRGVAQRRRKIPSRITKIRGNQSRLVSIVERLLEAKILSQFHHFKSYHRDSIRSNEEETVEYLVTGSVDDAVKVWELQDGALQMKHKLTGHSLGVVSVAVSSDGSSK